MPYFKLSDYDYILPERLIAQHPRNPRGSSRLLILDRIRGTIRHSCFDEIASFFNCGDQLIVNDTKVIPARLNGVRSNGGKAELLLLKFQSNKNLWEVLTKPARKLPCGSIIKIHETFSAEIIEELGAGRKLVQFHSEKPFWEALDKFGKIPLPPYIRNGLSDESDKDHYQTVFAKKAGASAAPTAGLHFTSQLMNDLTQKGVSTVPVTLHVGLGTFQPVQIEDIRLHPMHVESCHILPEAANLWSKGRQKWQLSVGTTACRVLESAICENGALRTGSFDTNLFIYPGYNFNATKALLTNFHLPKSSLLMLVSAFAGYELMRKAYAEAIRENYQFFSYGDAMLIM